jgi:2-polyprenyl-3-methyl-5-hydroxy-6-metoxy-1,4-benzoquinol methylase
MATPAEDVRRRAYGQDHALSPVDRFGVWLSGRRINRTVGDFTDKRVGDFGCGYEASFARSLLGRAAHVTLVDVALAPDLVADPSLTAIEGALPGALAGIETESLDVIVCNSVLEHLVEPQVALDEFMRLLAPGGTCMVNVPSWRGKWFLEYSAFRRGTSPPEEMDDHKMYYDPRDLWPMLVKAGFRPSDIRCFRHKFGMNTWAVCRRRRASAS